VPSIVTLLYVGVGGFIGSVLRYLLKIWVQGGGTAFPIGTLVVNIIGSFCLGLFVSVMEYKEFLSEDTRLFLTVGLLGGFTTMSTFSYDSYRLLERKGLALFFMNVGGTIILTLLAVFLGIKIGLIFFNK
jgi:fluoride exporter